MFSNTRQESWPFTAFFSALWRLETLLAEARLNGSALGADWAGSTTPGHVRLRGNSSRREYSRAFGRHLGAFGGLLGQQSATRPLKRAKGK
jgi:hypothetical protein